VILVDFVFGGCASFKGKFLAFQAGRGGIARDFPGFCIAESDRLTDKRKTVPEIVGTVIFLPVVLVMIRVSRI
jgi:hypothetical protein